MQTVRVQSAQEIYCLLWKKREQQSCNSFFSAPQVSIAGSAIATLEKELSAASAAQKITKSVKPPQLKPHEVRIKAEPAAPPQFPFGEAAETYKSRYDVETRREIGVSMKGEAVREEHLALRKEGEAKVCY